MPRHPNKIRYMPRPSISKPMLRSTPPSYPPARTPENPNAPLRQLCKSLGCHTSVMSIHFAGDHKSETPNGTLDWQCQTCGQGSRDFLFSSFSSEDSAVEPELAGGSGGSDSGDASRSTCFTALSVAVPARRQAEGPTWGGTGGASAPAEGGCCLVGSPSLIWQALTRRCR